ncbi:MAG: hypothetical protein ISP92_09300 [Pseudomonadales bacterium]|jgi:hypothetical protein|nr:hypothetical protein [Pseudomonadales bacterium]MDA0762694.1 hypothetical protein [Pseudomonadota bacterium]
MNRLLAVGFVATALLTAAFAKAEPVMTLITVNTQDAAGYAAWAKSSAPVIAKANNATAMGLCSPTAGAEVMGDHYLWSFFDSQETAWGNSVMNPIVAAEVAKNDVERTVRTWDNWRIAKAAESTSDRGYFYNLWVKTDDLAGYLKALSNLEAELNERGHPINLQAFVGDTGTTAGTVMVSLGANDGPTLGRAMDARTEPWFGKILAKLEGDRVYEHGFAMICETYYSATP